jgi:hypothetical protein
MNEKGVPSARSDALGCRALLLALLSVPLMALAVLSGAGGVIVTMAAIVPVAAVLLLWFVERRGQGPTGRDDLDDDRCLEVHKVEPLHWTEEPE